MSQVTKENMYKWAYVENMITLLVMGFLIWKVGWWGLILLLNLNSPAYRKDK